MLLQPLKLYTHAIVELIDCCVVLLQGGGYMNADMVFRAYTEILFWKGDKRKQETDSDSSVSLSKLESFHNCVSVGSF